MRASTGRHGMETPGDCGPSWLWRLWPSAGGVTYGVPSGGLIYLPVRHAVPPVATVVVAEIADDVVVELLPLQPNERERAAPSGVRLSMPSGRTTSEILSPLGDVDSIRAVLPRIRG